FGGRALKPPLDRIGWGRKGGGVTENKKQHGFPARELSVRGIIDRSEQHHIIQKKERDLHLLVLTRQQQLVLSLVFPS
ncbi:MAG: hypothetical protein ABF379_09575, partial [Akkermansiaceae bacterium]